MEKPNKTGYLGYINAMDRHSILQQDHLPSRHATKQVERNDANRSCDSAERAVAAMATP